MKVVQIVATPEIQPDGYVLERLYALTDTGRIFRLTQCASRGGRWWEEIMPPPGTNLAIDSGATPL